MRLRSQRAGRVVTWKPLDFAREPITHSRAAEPGPDLLRSGDQGGCRGGGDLVSRLRLHLANEGVELPAGRRRLAGGEVARGALDLHEQAVRAPLVEPEPPHGGVEVGELL